MTGGCVIAKSEEDSFASLGTGSAICSACHCELSKKAWQSHQAARKLVDIFTLPEHTEVEKVLY